MAGQLDLFGTPAPRLPQGMAFQQEFLDLDGEAALLELVAEVSLMSAARMRLRPYPSVQPKKDDVINLELPPRSAYILRGVVRWSWQHSIAPTPALRYSITFRTRRDRSQAV